MEVETIKTLQEIVIEETLVRYTKDDIEQLIRVDLQKQGYKVKSISIAMDTKYVEDEWGMNRHQIAFLKSANVIVF